MGVIAVVVAGGPVTPPDPRPDAPADDAHHDAHQDAHHDAHHGARFDAVIAVDGGLDAALAAGLEPTVLLGDLDSVSAAGLAWVHERGVPVLRHSPDKDDTDTALALAHASTMRPDEVLLLGAPVLDRFDHLLGTVIALGQAHLAGVPRITAWFGGTQVVVLHPHRSRELAIGSGRTLSLLALHGACAGVCIDGVRWPLHDGSLRSASTLGVSNVSTRPVVTVSVGDGVLTVVVPPPFPVQEDPR